MTLTDECISKRKDYCIWSGEARRGWAEKVDILNSKTANELTTIDDHPVIKANLFLPTKLPFVYPIRRAISYYYVSVR